MARLLLLPLMMKEKELVGIREIDEGMSSTLRAQRI